MVSVVSSVGRRFLVVPVWLGHDAAYGLAGLADKSSRLLSCPHHMCPEVEARIVAMRHKHSGWGPGTVLYWLELEGLQQLPGRTRVERGLAGHETGA